MRVPDASVQLMKVHDWPQFFAFWGDKEDTGKETFCWVLLNALYVWPSCPTWMSGLTCTPELLPRPMHRRWFSNFGRVIAAVHDFTAKDWKVSTLEGLSKTRHFLWTLAWEVWMISCLDNGWMTERVCPVCWRLTSETMRWCPTSGGNSEAYLCLSHHSGKNALSGYPLVL